MQSEKGFRETDVTDNWRWAAPSGARGPYFLWALIGTAREAAEKVNLAVSAPKGASDFEGLTISLKRYPDTKPDFSASCDAMTFPFVLEHSSGAIRDLASPVSTRRFCSAVKPCSCQGPGRDLLASLLLGYVADCGQLEHLSLIGLEHQNQPDHKSGQTDERPHHDRSPS